MEKPILFLPNYAQAVAYTTPRKVIINRKIPTRDRVAHAQRLEMKFQQVWNESSRRIDERKAKAIPSRDGCYIEVTGQIGHELVVNSLENRRRKNGTRLLSSRNLTKNEIGTEASAILYVPKGEESTYMEKIKQYAYENTPKGNPKNQKLIDSIEDIQLALLESLWQDPSIQFPTDIARWCEVWLRTNNDNNDLIVDNTQRICRSIGIEFNNERLDFPERSVVVIKANQRQLLELFERSDDLAELRMAKEPVSFWSEMYNSEQVEWVDELLNRVILDDKGVSVCVLDTGINNGHKLLEGVCSDNELESYHPDWQKNDQQGHGTQMAGVALYGDLADAIESRGEVRLMHRISSGKILPPPMFPENNNRLYGEVIRQTISNCEIQQPDRKPIYCMAVSSKFETDHGRPSSWSAAIDSITSGRDDDVRRLFISCAGNSSNLIDLSRHIDYPQINESLEIQNPAQSWNAITVGAITEKTRITDDDYVEYSPLAQKGELSPHSTTSLNWEGQKWPNKPDIVLEGGNLVRNPNDEVDYCPDLDVLTISKNPIHQQFELFNATSASTAKAAWMAAQIQVALPTAWPETVKALMIHSAKWPGQLVKQFNINTALKGDIGKLLRISGYGVPNLEEATQCFKNHLTLVAEEYIQPFKRDGSTNEMHFFELPWPKEALEYLGDSTVKLKITLSYFIEPAPGQIGWNDRYSYSSHGLRFDLNSPFEDIDNFKKRVNKKSRENEDDKPEFKGFGTKDWLIGSDNRNRGTVQSDSIELSGMEMSQCNTIAIFPVGGWWKTRKGEQCVEKKTRYSLVVSLHSKEEDIDIYTPVANAIAIQVRV